MKRVRTTPPTERRSWSSEALADAADTGPLFINPIIFAEVSVRFSRVEELDEALPPQDYGRVPLPWEAAFLAGKAFVQYRRHGGVRTSTLPDFFVGAHAAVDDLALLTRDEIQVPDLLPVAAAPRPCVGRPVIRHRRFARTG